MNVAPCAAAGAVRADDAAVEFDELSDDREAEPQAAVRAGGRGVGLAEAIEDVGEELRVDPFAAVDDADLEMGVDAFEQDLHGAVARGELHGVAEQVPEDLLQAIRVAGDGARQRVEGGAEADAFRVGGGLDRFDRGADDGGQIDALDVEPDLAGDDAAHVEQIFDDLRLSAGVALDDLDPFGGFRRRELIAAEDLRPAEDGVERDCGARARAWRGTRPSFGSPVRARCGRRAPTPAVVRDRARPVLRSVTSIVMPSKRMGVPASS